jgi:hypothetical protein
MTPGHRRHWKMLLLSEVNLKISQPGGGAQRLPHLQRSLITWNSRVYEQTYAATSSFTTCSKQPYCTRLVAGLLLICNVYNNNQEHCLSLQMRCWAKSTYQTNDYRGQQKLLVQVKHFQHAKWVQNQVHLFLIVPPPHGASARIRVMAFPIFFLQFYFMTPTSNFVYGARTLQSSARCPPTR